MKYLILFVVWCASSFIALVTMAIFREYNPVYMIHFFTGIGIILLFGFFEAIKKDREFIKT